MSSLWYGSDTLVFGSFTIATMSVAKAPAATYLTWFHVTQYTEQKHIILSHQKHGSLLTLVFVKCCSIEQKEHCRCNRNLKLKLLKIVLLMSLSFTVPIPRCNGIFPNNFIEKYSFFKFNRSSMKSFRLSYCSGKQTSVYLLDMFNYVVTCLQITVCNVDIFFSSMCSFFAFDSIA